jgi:hypothetical protein
LRVQQSVRDLSESYRRVLEDRVLAERDPRQAANDLGITRPSEPPDRGPARSRQWRPAVTAGGPAP